MKSTNHQFRFRIILPTQKIFVLFLNHENLIFLYYRSSPWSIVIHHAKNGRWKILVPACYHSTAFHFIVSHVHILHFFLCYCFVCLLLLLHFDLLHFLYSVHMAKIAISLKRDGKNECSLLERMNWWKLYFNLDIDSMSNERKRKSISVKR